jgi:hypothetical protein
MDKTKKDLLVFGYGLGIISLIFAVGGTIRHGLGLFQIVLYLCALVFFGVTAFQWEALKPGHAGWMKVAHFIGGIVTTVVLSAVFFLLFAPIGIFFRIIGKDHLERKTDQSASSYWHLRPSEIVDKARHFQQF